MNNKVLFGIFALLVIAFLASKTCKGDRKGNFDSSIVAVDTAQIDQIIITPKEGGGEPFSLQKEDGKWMANQGSLKVPATSSAMKAMLERFVKVDAKRVVSKSPDKFSTYEVEEGKATRIQANAGKKSLADFLVGSFKFDQATRSASSYMRKSGQNEVYVVDGFLSMSFNQSFDNFRDKTLISLNQSDITRIALNSNGEERLLQNLPEGWHFNGMEKMDSTEMASYLSSISNISGSDFIENFNPSEQNKIAELNIGANNIMNPVILEAYQTQDSLKPFVVHSSLNPDAYFSSDSIGVFQRIFGKLQDLMPN